MSYKKGDVGFGINYDVTSDCDDEKRCFYLPHSCDDWIIGGVAEAKQLINDLTEKIKEIELK